LVDRLVWSRAERLGSRLTLAGRVRLEGIEPNQKDPEPNDEADADPNPAATPRKSKVRQMAQTTEIPQTEREKVESWRLHVLVEAGYPLDLAEKIAHSDADLHHAVELVTAGCTHETAAEILL
jgi:hypothetical protein